MKAISSKKGGMTTLQSDEISETISKLPKENQDRIAEANNALDEMMDDVFNTESEQRMRSAGYLPSQVEDMAKFMKKNNIQVGQIFEFGGKNKVLTPFKTVVDSQAYVTALQERLFEMTTVDQEVMVSQLKTKSRDYDAHLQWFTSLSFFGLISLAFKRAFNNLFKGKNNG